MATRSLTRLDKYVTELQTWENQLEPLRTQWTKLWREWLVVPGGFQEDDDTTKYRSKLRIPYGMQVVETITPRIIGTDPTMSYRALDDVADDNAGRLQSALVSWQMEQMGFRYEARRFVRQALVTGYSVAKHGWIREEADQTYTTHTRTYDSVLNQVFTHREDQTHRVTVKNGPFVETVNNFDFVWPITARNLDECTAVWQRRYVTMGYLRAMQKAGVYSNVDEIVPTGLQPSDEWRTDQFDYQGISISNAHLDPDDDDVITAIWERWTDGRLCTVAEPGSNAVIIREEDNPFNHGHKPFFDYSPVPHPFQMPGQGPIVAIFDLNEDLNTQRRQRRDSLTFSLAPAWKTTEGMEQDQIVVFPGKVFDGLEDVNDLVPMTVPPVDFPSAHSEEERTVLDIQNMSGAYATLSGNQSDAGQAANTATGISTLTNEGNRRIQEMINEFADRACKRFGRMSASMNAQFLTESVAVDFSKSPQAAAAWQAITSDQAPLRGPIQVTPDYFKANGRLEPIPDVGQDEDLNKVQRRSDATQLVQAMGPMLAMQPPAVNVKKLTEMVAKAFDLSQEDAAALADNTAELQRFADAMAAQQAAKTPPQTSGPSGPSGESTPTGQVGGFPGAAGTAGPGQ